MKSFLKDLFIIRWHEFKKFWNEFGAYWFIMGFQIGIFVMVVLFTIIISIFGVCE